MAIPKRSKRSYSGLSAPEVFALIGRRYLDAWEIGAPARAPSPALLEHLRRLDSFAVAASEAGKELLIDAFLAEIVSLYSNLRVWKDAPLETDTLTGSADYLIAPYGDYLSTPLLCAVEAKRDDFEAGETQCIAEMVACRRKNEADGLTVDLYGIVSNGRGWVFYRWTADDSRFERTGLLGSVSMPALLGALDYLCAACSAQVPPTPTV